MYYTDRCWYKYGNEEDEIMITTLEHETFEKALKYARRYARGLRYYIGEDGLEEDYRIEK